MKSLILLILILFALKAFCQDAREDTLKKYNNDKVPVISANEAYKYFGKKVILVDSLYNYKIINDSTVACHMGEKLNTPRLTLIFIDIYNKNQGSQLFNTLKRYRLNIYGTITGAAKAPIMLLRGGNNLHLEDRRYHRRTD